MIRLRYQVLAAVLSVAMFGCAPAPTPTAAPAPTPKAAPAVTPKAAPATTSQPVPTSPSKAPVSFKGKTVTILVPYSAGGAADIRARLIGPFIEKHFPGNPTVVVQNMPGGGGMVGDNWVFNVAPKDGTVIGQPSEMFPNAVLAPEQVKYDAAKWQWLGAVASASPSFIDARLGIRNAEELPKLTERVFLGDTSVSSMRTIPARILLKLLGKDSKFVTGYGSSGDTRTALRRGELHIAADGLEGYLSAVRPMVEEGLVVPLAQDGIVQNGRIVRDPRLRDTPTYTELLVTLKGEGIRQAAEFRAIETLVWVGALKSIWLYPPGVPSETVAAVATAFERIFTDPELPREFEKAAGVQPISLNAAQVRQHADLLVDQLKKDPEAVEVLRKLAREAD